MKRVAVVPVIRKEEDNIYTMQTVRAFLKNGAEVWMENEHKDKPYSDGAFFADADEIYQKAELVARRRRYNSSRRRECIAL